MYVSLMRSGLRGAWGGFCITLLTAGIWLHSGMNSALAQAAPNAKPAAPVAPAATGTNRSPAMVSFGGRILQVDPNRNSLSVSNITGIHQVQLRPTTRNRVGGTIVKSSDFTAGSEVMVRGELQSPTVVSAIFVVSRPPTAMPGMKPAAKPGNPPPKQ